jgi:hypothetical protein
MDRALAQRIKDTYGDVEKGTRGYKVASIQSGTVPHLSIDCREVSTKEPTHPSHWFCSRPRREVRRRPTNELGEVPGEPVGTRLQRSTRSRI